MAGTSPAMTKRLCPRRERMRSRAPDLAAGRCYAQYSQTTFIRAIRTKTENTVDACESRCVGQHRLAEALRALCFHKRCDQRDCVIGERRRAHRILSIACAIASREIAKAGRFRRRVPAGLERRGREDARVVP